MRKFADISLAVEEAVVEGQSLVRIRVTPISLRDWCLCLQLLQENLIESFTFRRAGSPKTMRITQGVGNHSGMTDSVDGPALSFNARDLDVVRHFFLRYYRDGAAPVDHIDLETKEGGYIILAVDEFLSPVSPEEAKRQLGM